ncbi:hypothetical protein V9T40_002554 [Parthenolecanium corni]|uniref:Uncharacterized protein n=1 Tax=Parthenolecanium corni TaxID=536013 RepID=A0AAN9Y3W3_9HEMI
MQDVKTKREARRRRILENSEKRLQKITLLKYEEDEIIPEHLLTVSSTKATNDEVNIDDTDLGNTQFTNITSNNRDYPADSTVRSSFNHSQSSPSTKSSSNKNSSPKIWKKLGFKLVILAIIVRIVHIFRLGYLFGETVVIPFSVFMLTQLGSCQFDQNIAGITGPQNHQNLAVLASLDLPMSNEQQLGKLCLKENQIEWAGL